MLMAERHRLFGALREEGISVILISQGSSEHSICCAIPRDQAERVSFSNLMVVRFKGTCVLKPVPYLYDERGPMAFTYSTEGEVQPFSEVACDQVTRVVRSAMSGSDFARADLLMGRALGRVLAHEVVHILTKSGTHGHDGIAKTALSGSQLIGPELRLEP